jgi:putative ABC transport system ATP-binding protein
MNAAIKLENVLKQYPPRIRAVNGISMRVPAGERVCIQGAPGSGKTTLMRLIAGMEPVSDGSIFIFDTPLHTLSDDARAEFRNRMFGVIQRDPAFFKSLSVAENVALPLTIRRVSPAERLRAAQGHLEALGIAHLSYAWPERLSPFETRLCAAARALIAKPDILLLDDVCAGLSEWEARKLADTLDALWRDGGYTMLCFTGASECAIPFDKKFSLHYGKLQEDEL